VPVPVPAPVPVPVPVPVPAPVPVPVPAPVPVVRYTIPKRRYAYVAHAARAAPGLGSHTV